MKKLLPLISLILVLLTTFSGVLQAQVLNDDKFNIEVHFVKGQMSFPEGTTSSDVTMIGRAVPRNGNYNPIFSYAQNALNNPKSCYTYKATGGDPGTGNYWNYGPIVDENMGTLIDNADQFFKYEIRSWKRQFGNTGCIFQNGDSRAASRVWSVSAQTTYPSLEWYEYPVIEYDDPGNIGKRRAVIKSTWRYAKGERSAPLDFGPVAANQTLTHTNSNRSAVAGANAKLGYQNDWTAANGVEFSDKNDVTYTFSVDDSRTVSITTAFNSTNFDSKVHLVSVNIDGSYGSYITGNDSRTSGLNSVKGAIQNYTICKGSYAIIVEGGNDQPGINTGDFFLVLDVSNVYVLGGTITGGGSVPNPQEFPKIMTSTTDARAGSVNYVTWEIKPASGNWQYLSGTGAGGENALQSYTFNGTRSHNAQLSETTSFRRRVDNRCWDIAAGTNSKIAYSNEVTFTVYPANGTLSGRVLDRDNIAVPGVTITATRNTAIAEGVANKVYTTTTGADGRYSIQQINYGPSTVTGSFADFTITPSEGAHVFNAPSEDRTLNQPIPQQSNIDFVDETALSITGKITQECTDCIGATAGNPVIYNVKDVAFLVDGNSSVYKTIADGTYAVSVDASGDYVIKPVFGTHQFTPAERTATVDDQVAIQTPNINFKDITTHQISGYVRAGCNEFIGQTTLRFTQVLSNGNNGPFIKDIQTAAGSGFYTINLPAAKYSVAVMSLTPDPTNIDPPNPPTVVNFLNALPTDSLTRDATEADKTLDMVYPRPPVLEVVGLDNVCTSTTPFALIEQNKIKVLTVKVWQGAARTCPAKDSIVYVNSNIELDDQNKEYELPNVTGEIILGLKGGTPNIASPYFKTFDVQYTDIYDRAATGITKNVAVTGIKTPVGQTTFTTVTPQIPFRILHDPQGDQSYSFWESNTTSETAFRLFRTESDNKNIWAEVKIGREFETGIGVSTETSIWGSVNGSMDVGGYNTTENESIMSISTTQNISTASNDEVVGRKGDVYIGAAMNLKYARTNVLSYQAPCTLTLTTDVIVAPDGFATEYIYTESNILENIVPSLKDFAASTANTPAQTNFYRNQIRVWEQIVGNNAKNKKRATFEKNISFDGAAGAISSTTTTSSSKSNTIEFGTEINKALAIELGFEVGGSGVSGGSVISMKMETGKSQTTATTQSTTTGYVLDDNENGDIFSIDIKKDPVYGTPVFELVAGESSCPWEEGTVARDAMQLVASPTTVPNIAPDGEAEFTLQLSNVNQTSESRTYLLTFDQTSNSGGAEIKINGSPVVGGVGTPFTIGSGNTTEVIVRVKRGSPTSKVYSHTGLTFTLSDNCGGEVNKSVALNAYFNSPCSNMTLFAPDDNWVNNSNTLQVHLKDYVTADLNSVALEYSTTGVGGWATAFTKTSAELAADGNAGTLVNWDVTNIPEGNYKLRLKTLCGGSANLLTYSNAVTGILDRQTPQLLGIPEPTDANYVVGDVISAQFTEKLGCLSLNNTNVLVKNLTTNTTVNAQLGCFENGISIVPLSSLGVNGDSVRVTLLNIVDTHGNVKATADSWKFIIGTSVAATGNLALSLKPASPSVVLSQQENTAGTMDLYFSLPVNAPNDVLINYSVSESASSANDYTVSYFPINQPTSTSFNGTSGTITIRAGQKTAILKIDPTSDTDTEPNETIIVTLLEGGDYGISADYTLTATILNDDGENCENGGVAYQLANNAVSNTSLTAGTYHKSLLETDGKVISPTNVVMKGARSIVMQPGFEVRSGAIFSAQIEDCPELVTTSAYSVAVADKPVANQFQFVSSVTSTTTVQPNVQFEPSITTAHDANKVYFEFTLEKDEVITLQLLDSYGAEKVRAIDNQLYKAGTFTVEIETESLKSGTYFIKLLKNDKKIYQQVNIQ